MTNDTISADDLRDRLTRGDPVTVVDIRSKDQYDEWHIPESKSLPAYQRLKAGEPGPLADLDPEAEPVVTVCGRGAMAAEATQALRDRGVDARTLEGGLRAWSTAWNTAKTRLAGTEATLVQVRRVGKGCLSYVLGSGDEAVVVDPALDPEVFGDVAKQHGWTITHVLETHLHADHVSRARPLAQAAGAKHLAPAGEPAEFDHEPVAGGDVLRVGSLTIEVHDTPGHTPGSVSYLVNGEVLLTGDTLFVNAVGRPDLEAEGREAERARALHASLQRLLKLPDDTLVLPAHADRPLAFDGKVEGARLGELPDQIDLLGLDEDAFVDRILNNLPETPANHDTIVDHNRQARWPDAEITELEAGANRCAAG